MSRPAVGTLPRSTSEREPLLREPLLRAASGLARDAEDDADADVDAATPTATPLPRAQIALLTFTRVCEPLAFAILFPFVNSFVLSTGEVTPAQVGYYVGLIESCFSFTQMVFLVPWGWAADKYGRKPILIISLAGACASTLLFGLSSKLWQMILARSIAGLFGGNAVVVRTLFAEFSDKSNQARAFSFFAFASNFGIFIGPVIGGTFAEPAKQLPHTIGKITLFQWYPYLLPCLITAVYTFLALIANIFLLKEPAHREQDEKIPFRRLVTPALTKVMLIYGFAMFLGIANTAILPLFAFTPIELGGLSFTPAQIALLIGAAGISQSLWILLVMPPLDKRLGTRTLLRACYALWPIGFLMPIGASQLAIHGKTKAMYALMAFLMLIGSGVSIAFTSTQLLVNNAAPPGALASVNGFALTLTALIRSATPASMTSLFALGVERNIVHHYLAWVVLAAIAVVAFVISGLAPREEELQAKTTSGRRVEGSEDAAEA